MTELTELEKRLVALALEGIAMRQGPTPFEAIEQVADKLGVTLYLREYLGSWISYVESHAEKSSGPSR